MEKLAGEKEKWYEKQVSEKNKYEERRQELSDANADIKATNKAFDDYRKALVIECEGTLTREPNIWDYYEPSDHSDEMSEYMTLTIGTLGLLGGWAGEKTNSQDIIKSFKISKI